MLQYLLQHFSARFCTILNTSRRLLCLEVTQFSLEIQKRQDTKKNAPDRARSRDLLRPSLMHYQLS